MSVNDIIGKIRDNKNTVYIDVSVEPASNYGYLVKLEYMIRTRSNKVVPHYKVFVVPGEGMSPKDVLDSDEYYYLSVSVSNRYSRIWRKYRRYRGFRI